MRYIRIHRRFYCSSWHFGITDVDCLVLKKIRRLRSSSLSHEVGGWNLPPIQKTYYFVMTISAYSE